jgi:hypothetical protein
MKKITKTTLSISLLLILNACSFSPDVVAVSDEHAYNSNYGLVENYEVDNRIQEEILAQNLPTEIRKEISNPDWTTELILDPDAVTAEEYVQAPEVITYKYKFDPKFYDEAIWKSGE